MQFFFKKKPRLKQHCIHLWCRSLSHPRHFHRIQLLWILTFNSDRTCYFTFRYAIMMDCWETEPENRPSFDSLCNKIKRLEMGVNQVRNPSVWFRDLFNRSKVIFFLLKLPTETVLWFNYYYYKSSVRKKKKELTPNGRERREDRKIFFKRLHRLSWSKKARQKVPPF